MKRFLYNWLPVLLVAGGIFYSSATPYKEQDLRPRLSTFLPEDIITALFSWVHFTYAGSEVSIERLGAPGFIEFFIRKLSHFSVYFLLAILLYRALAPHCKRLGWRFFFAWVVTIAYAASDELHQHFTPGRSMHAEDVMLDSFGGLVGLLLALAFTSWRRKRRRRR
ncbi:hypothetical protein A374_06596 [Fictibacillus macauensis ZFHKF-1]|uniref:VanZ-like domain-containing protein n=1 Tax=Fictibacillus macauensis ZFHKF-1 TaxID=1196324 RepID=I8AK76_9BACL|nr:VanZ family protein [Fictibacillus macauensis]EIT86247.1 hypothetical protein A374_06596 [Fictibacillus macauensis ZFHKF-1]